MAWLYQSQKFNGKDIKKKYIFQGDIVKFKTRSKGKDVWVISEVIFEDGGFFVSVSFDYFEAMLCALNVNERTTVEIVGNIYNDPGIHELALKNMKLRGAGNAL